MEYSYGIFVVCIDGHTQNSCHFDKVAEGAQLLTSFQADPYVSMEAWIEAMH